MIYKAGIRSWGRLPCRLHTGGFESILLPVESHLCIWGKAVGPEHHLGELPLCCPVVLRWLRLLLQLEFCHSDMRLTADCPQKFREMRLFWRTWQFTYRTLRTRFLYCGPSSGSLELVQWIKAMPIQSSTVLAVRKEMIWFKVVKNLVIYGLFRSFTTIC